MIPIMARRVVVLPTPLRPISVIVSPGQMSRSTPCRAWLSPYQALSPRTDSKGWPLFMFGSHISGAHALVFGDGGVIARRENLAALQHRDVMGDIGHHFEIVFDHQHRTIPGHIGDEGGN